MTTKDFPKIINLFIWIFLINCQITLSQDISSQIIELEKFEVKSEGFQLVYNPNFSKKNVRVGVKGEAVVVSILKLDKVKNRGLQGLEFFFNHKWYTDEVERFLIRPVIYSDANGRPGELLFEDDKSYSINKNLNERFFIDLVSYNLNFDEFEQIFIGFQLLKENDIELEEDFNFVMNEVKSKSPLTYLKISCSNCNFFPDTPTKNRSIVLKYVAYF